MKRREIFRLVPLSIAGFTGIPGNPFAREMFCEKKQAHHPESLAIQYTKKVREMLRWIRETQSENILEASHIIARTYKNGGTCWCIWDMGHSALADVFPGRNGEPEIFIQKSELSKLAEKTYFGQVKPLILLN